MVIVSGAAVASLLALAVRGDAFLADLNDGEPENAQLTLTSSDHQARCKARYREFIDSIAVGTTAAARGEPGSFEEYDYGGIPEDEHPSDHCPIAVRLAG